MSYYRRFKGGKTQRWNPEEGEFFDCNDDEPETRIRKPGEGMIVLPARIVANTGLVETADLLECMRKYAKCQHKTPEGR